MTPAERRAAYRRLRMRGLSIGEAAAHLGCSRRTAERYEQGIRTTAGIPSPQRPAWWMWEPILDHLRKHPHVEFTGCDLGRVLDASHTTARRTLCAMAAAGLVERLVCVRDEASPCLVARFRLAVREEARAA